MVVGKLLILLSGSLLIVPWAHAGEVQNPTFYSYNGGSFVNKVISMSFGYFRKLDRYQYDAYNQAVSHAVMMADNGERVQWFEGDASGFAAPVYTWPTHSGNYCRRIHIQVIAYNQEKTITQTACFNGSTNNWRWVE